MFDLDPKIPEVTVEMLKNMMDNNENLLVIDVRTIGEYEKGKIPGSINIPVDQIESIENKSIDKNSRIYVYCLSGSRSAIAVDRLIKMGYKNAFNVKSGLLAWRVKYPLS